MDAPQVAITGDHGRTPHWSAAPSPCRPFGQPWGLTPALRMGVRCCHVCMREGDKLYLLFSPLCFSLSRHQRLKFAPYPTHMQWWVGCCDSSRFGRRDSAPLSAHLGHREQKSNDSKQRQRTVPNPKKQFPASSPDEIREEVCEHIAAELLFSTDELISRGLSRESGPLQSTYSIGPSPRLPRSNLSASAHLSSTPGLRTGPR